MIIVSPKIRFLDCDQMLPKVQSLAEQRGVTVDCKPSTEKMNADAYGFWMAHTAKYKDISTELKFPGQFEMTCSDASGNLISRETSFSLSVFEAWILSDRCHPSIVSTQCYQPGEIDFYKDINVHPEHLDVTNMWILEVNWVKPS